MSETEPRPAADSDELVAAESVIHLHVTERFEAFYLRELPSLVALARALTGSPSSAEDLAQEAMIAAYRRWDEVAAMGVPASWVRRVCANLATSQLRRRTVETRALLRLGGRRHQHTELPPTDDAFWAAVRRLPRRQAQAIALHYVYDMYVADIALTLECSESTVKAHLVRGRTALAQRLGLEEGDEVMTVDSAGRSAAAALHRATTNDLEVHTMLDQLQHDSRRTKGFELAALVGAAALLVGVGWMFLRPADEATTIPGGTVLPPATAINFDDCFGSPNPCSDLAAGVYSFPLEIPFTAQLPQGWNVDGDAQAADIRSQVAGLFVVLDPQGSKPVAGRTPDPAAGTTAESMASWLAERPYLEPTRSVATTVSGMPAWQVDVRLNDSADATFTCQPEISECVPMVLLPFGENATGITSGQVGRMIFVEMPDKRVVLVYATNGPGETLPTVDPVIAQVQPLIDSLRFDTSGI